MSKTETSEVVCTSAATLPTLQCRAYIRKKYQLLDRNRMAVRIRQCTLTSRTVIVGVVKTKKPNEIKKIGNARQ